MSAKVRINHEPNKLQNILHYVIPTILSGCCFFFFTVIDGIFVGRGVTTDALGALNIVLPFTLLVYAISRLITIGGVTITAIRIGRGDIIGANQAFMHSLFGIVIISILFCVSGLCFAGQLTRFLGANDTYFNYVYDYLFWYVVFLIPAQLGIVFQGFCRNDGSPRLTVVATIAGTACNIFLDWLFIFPLQKGMAGAAVATGISQTIYLCIILTHFIRRKGSLRVRIIKPNFTLWRKIVLRGLPEMVAQFSTPVTTICMNFALIKTLGDAAVNAFAIINYAASFSLMIFLATSDGLQPLFGQSYGAKNKKELHYYFRAGVFINFSASVVFYILLLFLGETICVLFGANEVIISVILNAMPKYALSFFLSSLNTIISTYLYSTKQTREAVIINISKGLILNSLTITIFPTLFGMPVVWFTVGIAETLTLTVAIVLLKHSETKGIIFK